MPHPSKSAFRFAPIAILTLLAAGCATTDTKPATENAKPADEYVVIEPEIGSRVKRRVKKSELKKYVGSAPTQRAIVTDQTDTTMTPSMTTGEVEASNPGAMRPPGT